MDSIEVPVSSNNVIEYETVTLHLIIEDNPVCSMVMRRLVDSSEKIGNDNGLHKGEVEARTSLSGGLESIVDFVNKYCGIAQELKIEIILDGNFFEEENTNIIKLLGVRFLREIGELPYNFFIIPASEDESQNVRMRKRIDRVNLIRGKSDFIPIKYYNGTAKLGKNVVGIIYRNEGVVARTLSAANA